jgi:phage FluMu protein Com
MYCPNPKCGKYNVDDAKFCVSCGEPLESGYEEDGNNDSNKKDSDQIIYCSRCGAPNVDEAEFCEDCGERLIKPESIEDHFDQIFYCSRCGAPNVDEAEFCVDCGEQLIKLEKTVKCPHCDVLNFKEAERCENCGKLLIMPVDGVKCPYCRAFNFKDAKRCENCGELLNGDIDGHTNGISKNIKILLVSAAVLIILVGIAVFMLSQGGVTKDNFPVSEAPNLAAAYSGNTGNVNYQNVDLDKNQRIYILAKAIVMINNGDSGSITVKDWGDAEDPKGYINSDYITKAQYIDIASRTYQFMDRNNRTPNYVGISEPNQPDLAPNTVLNLFSKVLSEYKSTGKLPEGVSIP